MRSAEEIVRRAEAERAAGRIWRAKEILRGSIGSGRVEPVVLEAYGRLLESLGERVEAGRYLFASGVREPEYEETIALFKSRCSDRRCALSRLPAALRRKGAAGLPATVLAELTAMNLPHRPAARGGGAGPVKASPPNGLKAAGCLLAGTIAIIGTIVGLMRITGLIRP